MIAQTLLYSWVLPVVLGTATSCGDLKALSSLSQDLQNEYHMIPDVDLEDGEVLTISFARAAVDAMKLDSAGHEAFTRRVATFAKHHYSDAQTLERIIISTNVGVQLSAPPFPGPRQYSYLTTTLP